MKSPRKGHCLANLPPIIIIKLEGAFDKTRNLPAFLWIFVYKSTIDSKIECDSLGNRLCSLSISSLVPFPGCRYT